MKIIVIGASGTIGSAVTEVLAQGHDVVAVSRSAGDHRADITDKASLERLFSEIGPVDAIVSVAGSGAFKPLPDLSDADFDTSLRDKLMGQVNVVRTGMAHVIEGGSITITTGVLAQQPMPGSAAISLVNAGLEGFMRAAALELAGKVRVNVVSPPWVSETLTAMQMDPSQGLPAARVAQAYVKSIASGLTGEVISPE